MNEQKQEPMYSGVAIYHSDGSQEEQVFKDGKFLMSTKRQYMPNGAYVTTTMSIGKVLQQVCF